MTDCSCPCSTFGNLDGSPHDAEARHPNPKACEHAEYRPSGYWSARVEGGISAAQFDSIRDRLQEATAQGLTIVVLDGITLTWMPA